MRSRLSKFAPALFCVLMLFFFASTANAQFRGGVQGTVTDTAGAVIPQATVTLTNSETNKTQAVDASDDGFYRISGLPPGRYSLTVEKSGYKKQSLDNLLIGAEETQGLDLKLEAGDVLASVTVTDALPSQLETENANIGKGITNVEVRQLPQVGRDPYELLRLTPGVFGDGARSGGGNAVSLPNQSGPGGSNRSIFQTENQPQISANGQRVSANVFQIDGTSVNSLTWGGAAVITPNQESVKEVRVMSSAYSAEYGRNSGAQVLTVSQNGTNAFHGSLFLKNNSPGLNAFNKFGGLGPSLNRLPPVRNNQHYNQYGGSIGGPLPIPRFGEGPPPAFKLARNRAFFFFSYEALRSNVTDTFSAWVETPQYRQLVQTVRPGSVTARILGAQGIAPRILSVIPVTCVGGGFNATNCQQVAGGLDIGSPAGATGQYLSFGNLQGGGFDGIPDIQFAQIAAPNSSRGKQYNPRLDINLTSTDTLTFSGYLSRFTGEQSDIGGRSRPMGDVRTAPKNFFGMITYVRTLSSSMLNEMRFNATRFAFNEIESSTETNWGLPRIEIEALPFDRIRFGAPWSETTPGIFAENTFEFRDTLRMLRGNHSWSFGAEWRQEQDNNNLVGGARPLYTFGGLFNFANSTPLFYQITADPRTGGPPVAQRYFRNNNYSFFAQDDWKVRPNFTLNLGLRWEYFGPLTERDGRISNLVLGSGATALTGARLVVSDQLYPSDKNNFGPRLGFAWSPAASDGKLVIRGGGGVAYNRIPTVVFANSRGNPPFFERVSICCGTSAADFSTPFAGGQILYAVGADNTPFSYPTNPALRLTFNPATGVPTVPGGFGVEVWGAPAEVPTPYVYTYSLESQYDLPGRLTGTLGYQGSSSRKLMRLVNQRFIYPNPGNFWASNVFFPTPDTNASYNALIATLSRRFSKGFGFNANYRWAKSIDIVSNEAPTASTNPTYPLDIRQERGPSDYDVRHHLVASGIWDLPIFRNRSDAAGKILGGWQVSGIATFHTGFPWTPVIGQCVTTLGPSICPARPSAYFGGAGNDTSNDAFINGTNFPGGSARFFDTTAPGARLPGVGRNSFRGPNYRNIDLSLTKRFGMPSSFGEGTHLELKANFFNIFNILNLQSFGFNTPSTVVGDSRFGRPTAGLSGRVIEIQGRFSF